MRQESASDPSLIAVFIGTPAIAGDGTELGMITEVRGDQFRVEGPLGAVFWLDKRTVQSADDRETLLAYDRTQTAGFKLKGPGAAARSPAIAEQMETFSSEHEQVVRRRQMERGYG